MADEALSPQATSLYLALSEICAGQPAGVVADAALGVVTSAMLAQAQANNLDDGEVLLMVGQFAGDLAANVLASRNAPAEHFIPLDTDRGPPS